MTSQKAIDEYLNLRPASLKQGTVGQEDEPDIFAACESCASVAVVKVRCIAGETFQTIIDGSHVVFIDTTNTEYAQHIFDGVFAEGVPFSEKREIGRALDQKRLARSLFSIGRTCEAHVAAHVDDRGLVAYDSSVTPLTAVIDAQERARFTRRFERFALAHEFAHVNFRITATAASELRGWLTRAMREIEISQLVDAHIQRNAEALDLDPVATGNVKALLTSGELKAFFATTALTEQMSSFEFQEEILCDLTAIRIEMASCRGQPSALVECAHHLGLVSKLTALFRHQQFEQVFLEYLFDALPEASFEELTETDFARLDARARLFVEQNGGHYEMAQRGFLRSALIRVFMLEQIESTGEPGQSSTSIQTEMDQVEARTLEFLSAIVGPAADWGYRLLSGIAAGRRFFVEQLRERGYDDSTIQVRTRRQFLELNGMVQRN